MRASAPVILVLVIAAALSASPSALLAAGARHSGVVATVDATGRSVVVNELAEEGRPRRIEVQVPPQARLSLVERVVDELAPQKEGEFKERTIELADVRPGDFVLVEGTQQGRQVIADVVTVTLRAGTARR
jgi:hypothetical protein